MQHVATLFDRIVEDIGEAGQQLTAMAACEGSAGNISVFVTSLWCPLDPAADIELPAAVPALAGGWVVITAGGRRLRDVTRRAAATVVALNIDESGRSARMHAAPGVRPSSELNSHLAIHDDHRHRRGVEHHVVLHAQPVRLVFLSHTWSRRLPASISGWWSPISWLRSRSASACRRPAGQPRPAHNPAGAEHHCAPTRRLLSCGR
jgi:rhamnulose-1-phosphate aldolase